MKIFAVFFMFYLWTTSSSAQNSWHYMGNSASNASYTGRIDDVYFLNKTVGLALGDNIMKTTDGGDTWVTKTNLSSNFPNRLRSIEFLDDQLTGIVGMVGMPANVYRTTDGGETWKDISLKIKDTVDTVGNRSICGLAHVGNIFYGVGLYAGYKARFYKSTDKGQTWTVSQVDTSLATQLIDVHFISADTGFASGSCSANGRTADESVVLKTTDGGTSWKKVFSDKTIGGRLWKMQFLTNQIAYGSIEAMHEPDTIAIIKSIDGGNSWQIIGVGREPSQKITQSVGFITPMRGWVGGWYNGVYETQDGGISWTKIEITNFTEDVNRFFRLDSNDMIASGYGIFRFGDKKNFTTSTQEVRKKETVILLPIYPNPTGNKIHIEFDLEIASTVILQVVNIEGKQVYPIINKIHRPGHYQYEWDASHLPDGQYMVWLDNDLAPITQKFTVRH